MSATPNVARMAVGDLAPMNVSHANRTDWERCVSPAVTLLSGKWS